MARFHALRTGQTRLPRAPAARGAASRTVMSRVIAPQPAAASGARHVPAAGDATSANQKYGGPPWRSRDLAATLPSGAISESSPSSGFSAAKMTRSGCPSTAPSAWAGPRSRPRLRRRRPTDFGRARPPPRKGGQKMRPRSAAMPSPRRQTGVLQTREIPFVERPKTASDPGSRGRLGRYRIDGDQSAGMKAILRPAEPSRRKCRKIHLLPFKIVGQRPKIKRSTVARLRGAAAAVRQRQGEENELDLEFHFTPRHAGGGGGRRRALGGDGGAVADRSSHAATDTPRPRRHQYRARSPVRAQPEPGHPLAAGDRPRHAAELALFVRQLAHAPGSRAAGPGR